MTKVQMLKLLAALVPPAALATSLGGPIGHSGVPADNPIDNNGQVCQRCHNSFPVNSPGGYVRIDAFNYRAGQKQKVKVTVSHPEAVKWGFQLTARHASDLNKRAGTFTLGQVRVRCSDMPDGRDVTPDYPCSSDALEFAGHNQNIVFGGANGTKTFEVEWTAPDPAVGDIVFYAVGNAASNSGGNQNDRIYADTLTIASEGGACPNTARPTFRTATNAASGASELSMNTLVTLWGTDFAFSGTHRQATRADLRDGYPKELGCVAVEIGGERVPLVFVSHDQINAQMPTFASTGSFPVRVIVNPDRPNQLVSNLGTVDIQNHSPAFFTFHSNRKNVAAVHNSDGVYATDPAVVQGARPVQGGDILQLYATGLGPTNPVWKAGEMPDSIARLRDRLTVTVGGTTLPDSDLLYVGLVPGYISGFYQINVRLPATIPEGEVPIRMSIGGVSSPAGTVLNSLVR